MSLAAQIPPTRSGDEDLPTTDGDPPHLYPPYPIPPGAPHRPVPRTVSAARPVVASAAPAVARCGAWIRVTGFGFERPSHNNNNNNNNNNINNNNNNNNINNNSNINNNGGPRDVGDSANATPADLGSSGQINVNNTNVTHTSTTDNTANMDTNIKTDNDGNGSHGGDGSGGCGAGGGDGMSSGAAAGHGVWPGSFGPGDTIALRNAAIARAAEAAGEDGAGGAEDEGRSAVGDGVPGGLFSGVSSLAPAGNAAPTVLFPVTRFVGGPECKREGAHETGTGCEVVLRPWGSGPPPPLPLGQSHDTAVPQMHVDGEVVLQTTAPFKDRPSAKTALSPWQFRRFRGERALSVKARLPQSWPPGPALLVVRNVSSGMVSRPKPVVVQISLSEDEVIGVVQRAAAASDDAAAAPDGDGAPSSSSSTSSSSSSSSSSTPSSSSDTTHSSSGTPMPRPAAVVAAMDALASSARVPGQGAHDSIIDAAFHYAVSCGMPRAVRIAASLGARVNAPDAHGFTAAHRAAASGDVLVCAALFDLGCDMNRVSPFGRTPSQIAHDAGHIECAEGITAGLAALGDDVPSCAVPPTYTPGSLSYAEEAAALASSVSGLDAIEVEGIAAANAVAARVLGSAALSRRVLSGVPVGGEPEAAASQDAAAKVIAAATSYKNIVGKEWRALEGDDAGSDPSTPAMGAAPVPAPATASHNGAAPSASQGAASGEGDAGNAAANAEGSTEGSAAANAEGNAAANAAGSAEGSAAANSTGVEAAAATTATSSATPSVAGADEASSNPGEADPEAGGLRRAARHRAVSSRDCAHHPAYGGIAPRPRERRELDIDIHLFDGADSDEEEEDPTAAHRGEEGVCAFCHRSFEASDELEHGKMCGPIGGYWFHDVCALFSEGVVARPIPLSRAAGENGVEVSYPEGVVNAIRNLVGVVCVRCGVTGAGLRCSEPGCDATYHFRCAVEDGCHLVYGARPEVRCCVHLPTEVKVDRAERSRNGERPEEEDYLCSAFVRMGLPHLTTTEPAHDDDAMDVA